jgi:hypothetical protein
MRPRKGSYTVYPSLAGILPKRLQALQLVAFSAPGKGADTLEELLGSLPGSKGNFPYLKNIFVGWRHEGHPSFPLVIDKQIEGHLESLCARLHEVKIILTWEFILAHYHCRPKTDWLGSPNVIDKVQFEDTWI